MINLRIFGIAILVTSIGFVTLGSQATLATEYIMLDADEAAMAGNTTNMTMGKLNQTESENMTGSTMNNSTG